MHEPAAPPVTQGPVLAARVATPGRDISPRRLQRKRACGSVASSLLGGCAHRGTQRALGIQAKLKVSHPGDRGEQEADAMADDVMRTTSGAWQGREQEARRDTTVAPAARAREALAIGAGGPLDATTRAFMEPRFGHDFGHVRVHADSAAAAAAEALDARAFTLGRDLVFAEGEYRPHTSSGRRLIAHELAHAVQQEQAGGVARETIQRVACPETCLECPPDGVVPEDCECIGNERPESIVPATVRVPIVRLHGGKSEGSIKRDIALANKTWRGAGIAIDAPVHSISRADTEKILGTDPRGRVRGNVEIEPADLALQNDSTRALLGLATTSGTEKLSIPAGSDVHSLVVYYVPEFNSCNEETTKVGCAFAGTHGGRFFALIEKAAQSATLAHELGHLWGMGHVEDKRNVMFTPASRSGIDAEQVRTARRVLGLGGLRCLAAGQGPIDSERIEGEQEKGQLIVRAIGSKTTGTAWRGPVTVNGTDRDSTIQFKIDGTAVRGSYSYDTPNGPQPGRILNGVVRAGVLEFDWEQGAGDEASRGKGSFTIGSAEPWVMSGRWGVGSSLTDGGTWSVALTDEWVP